MRRHTSAWAAIGAATVLLIAGCSSSVQGTAQPGTTATSTSAAGSTKTSATTTAASTARSSTGTSTSKTGTSETGTSTTQTSGTSAPSSPSGLDPDTEYWFTAFCTRAADVAQYVSPDTTGQTLAQAQATIVKAYSNISISASTSVGLLQTIPPPTVSGGGDLQTTAIERFTAVSDVYGRGAQTIAALTPTRVADLKSAIDAIEAEATASIPTTMANVDPSVITAAKRLPQCQSVLGG